LDTAILMHFGEYSSSKRRTPRNENNKTVRNDSGGGNVRRGHGYARGSGTLFIDCREVVVIEALSDKVNEKSPGIMSRLAPISNNTVIYTKDAKTVPRQKFDPRIADGFRVLDHSGK